MEKKRDGASGPNGTSKIAATVAVEQNAPTDSGHVEGQILRGSVQQKRKEEAPKDQMSFEEAVVSAIDFHGALSGTGSYAPPPEARGGKHKGARSWSFAGLFVLGASGGSQRG